MDLTKEWARAGVVGLIVASCASCVIQQTRAVAAPTRSFPVAWPADGTMPAGVRVHEPIARPRPTGDSPQPPPAQAASPMPMPTQGQAASPPEGAARPASANSGAPQPNNFALVVGVERYRDASPAASARADAERFVTMLRGAFGLPDDHIRLALDERATKADIESHLMWLKRNISRTSRVYFYFSGHGAPNTATGAPYLLPFDGNPSALETTALPLSELVASFNTMQASEVVAFLESCYSELPRGAHPLVPVKEVAAAAKVVVFSAAAKAQISGPSSEGGGGVFTKYVATAVETGAADLDGDGQISLDELRTWVSPRVARDAKKDNRDQTPVLSLGSGTRNAKEVIVVSGLRAR